jgi:hypothetical protein
MYSVEVSNLISSAYQTDAAPVWPTEYVAGGGIEPPNLSLWDWVEDLFFPLFQKTKKPTSNVGLILNIRYNKTQMAT